MKLQSMTIAGRAVAAAEAFDVVNPATGRVFAQAPACSRSQLEEAMAAGHQAFGRWRATPGSERQAALLRCAAALDAACESLATQLTLEQGKPIRAARQEITLTGNWLRYFAGLENPPPKRVVDEAHTRATLTRQPLGVVAAITPWNFPLLLAAMKFAPALLTGNTVVLKPSPFTPLATLAMGDLFRELLPPGVLNVVSGGNELGAWMTEHPVVRKVSFTGSVATGKAVAGSAARDLKRVTLELGGNDAAIVLPDADPRAIARGLMWGAFTNCGQVCAGIKRVYVPSALHDSVVQALAEAIQGIRVGSGLEESVQMGPVSNRPQFERLGMLLEDARAAGAGIIAGGQSLPGEGFFLRPTLVTQVDDDARVVAEEQFGPVLPVLAYDDLDEVVERVNGGMYGLSASVWGRDTAAAEQLAARLECGSVYINTHLVIRPELPFGGVKWSGIGIENGPWVLDEYTHPKVVLVETR